MSEVVITKSIVTGAHSGYRSVRPGNLLLHERWIRERIGSGKDRTDNEIDLNEALQLGIRLVDALEIIGEESEAFSVFVRILNIASAAGTYQAFVDGGPTVTRLLKRICESTFSSDDALHELLPYAGSLLGRLKSQATLNQTLISKSVPGVNLSGREHVTLVWMSHGLSNKKIAQKLGVTPETVKTHAKNIFIKLTVKTRAEAVFRATGLGII